MVVAAADVARRGWPRLQAAHEEWVLLYAVLLAAVTNAAINTGLGFLDIRHHSHIPRFGVSITNASVITQAVGTLFFLPFITCLITTYAIRQELQRGNIQRLDPPTGLWWKVLFPERMTLRGARLGLAALVALGPIVVVVLAVTLPHGLSRYGFVVFNSAFSVIFGAIATPIIAIAAMCDDVPAG
jgi:hypothetical protein